MCSQFRAGPIKSILRPAQGLLPEGKEVNLERGGGGDRVPSDT